MVSSLPDRPLSPTETVETSHSKSGFLMLPATPSSMFEGDQLTDVRDLLIVTENALAVLAYEESDGWVTVARFEETTNFEEAVGAIIDYREYAISEEDMELIASEYTELFDDEFM